MSDDLFDEQSAPSAPAAGKGLRWPDSAIALPCYRNSSRASAMAGGFNGTPAVASQLLGTGDTYVTGSAVLIPSFGLQVGSVYHLWMSLSKTAAGTATPVWTLRLGTAGSTADASQWTHTGVAQTAATETAFYEIMATVQSIGASGVLQASLSVKRTGGTAATGLASVPCAQATGAAASKDWTSGQRLGLSINAGASSAWTVTQCVAKLLP